MPSERTGGLLFCVKPALSAGQRGNHLFVLLEFAAGGLCWPARAFFTGRQMVTFFAVKGTGALVSQRIDEESAE